MAVEAAAAGCVLAGVLDLAGEGVVAAGVRAELPEPEEVVLLGAEAAAGLEVLVATAVVPIIWAILEASLLHVMEIRLQAICRRVQIRLTCAAPAPCRNLVYVPGLNAPDSGIIPE